jgi:ATP phosphoribosyltransferase regulatory subunit
MMDKVHWLLPEGIDEVVPPQAARIEQVRRELLDMFSSWGYDLVMPPFIEFLDSLLMGAGGDVDLKTFKVVDQVSGRLMGIRADMTTQVARIDAHHLQHDGPSRLCYMGTVLHALQDAFGGSRAQLQIGAELYGHAGLESDVEIISLMLESLRRAGVSNVSIDLGHVGIFRGLARQAGLDKDQEKLLFEALQRKAVTEISQYLEAFYVDDEIAARIVALSELNGSDIIAEARNVLDGASDEVTQALDNVEAVAKALLAANPDLELHYDLAELRGYNFHTGIVFSAYVPGSGVEIARGGRYDNIGVEFGRARPATGFSTDLKKLLVHSARDFSKARAVIFAPCTEELDAAQRLSMQQAINNLREQGQRVICELKGQSGTAADVGCNQLLTYRDNRWQVIPLND